jgi:hypothetical protein
METPYVGFWNDTLKKNPPLNIGDEVYCKTCNKKHRVEGGEDESGKKTSLLLFYKCDNGQCYLAGIAGQSVLCTPADCSGKS